MICPECGAPLQAGVAASDAVGYRLFDLTDSSSELPIAIEVALPVPDLEAR